MRSPSLNFSRCFLRSLWYPFFFLIGLDLGWPLTEVDRFTRPHAEVVDLDSFSEIKQVEISADIKSMQPPTRPDENGFLKWSLELEPRSKTVIEAAYWTRRRKEVVTT